MNSLRRLAKNTHSRCVFLLSLLDGLLACRLLEGVSGVVHTVSGGCTGLLCVDFLWEM